MFRPCIHAVSIAAIAFVQCVTCSNLLAQIPWTQDLTSATAAAQSRDGIIMLHFYSDNCVPCKALEARAFQDQALITKIRSTVVPVKVHVDSMPHVAEKFNVTRWPTDVYLAKDGFELARTVSPQKATDYMTLLDRVAIRNRDYLIIKSGGHVAQQTSVQQQSSLPREDQFAQPQNTFVPPQSALAAQRREPSFAKQEVAPAQVVYQQAQTSKGTVVNPYAQQDAPPVVQPPIQSRQVTNQYAQTQSVMTNTSEMMGNHGASSVPPIVSAADTRYANPTTQVVSIPSANVPEVASPSMSPQTVSMSTQAALASQQQVQRQTAAPTASLLGTAYNYRMTDASTASSRDLTGNNTSLPVQLASQRTPWNDGSMPVSRQVAAQLTAAETELASEDSATSAPAEVAATKSLPAERAAATEGWINSVDREKISQKVQALKSQEIGPAMQGYCPVALDEQSQWVKGSEAFPVRHRGRVYHLSSAAAKEHFLADPDRYAPMLSGYDLVHFLSTGEFVEGYREFGCWYKGRVYLFANVENRDYFDQNVCRVVAPVQATQPEKPAKDISGDANGGRIATTPSWSSVR